MEISSLLSLTFFIFLSLVQTDFVGANPTPVLGGIFERDAGEFKYTGQNGDGRNKLAVNETTTTEGSISPEPPIRATICPERPLIIPCNCTLDGGVYLICIGSKVNQMTLENAFREVRRVNEIPEDRGIDIFRFDVDSTELTQVDMAPFYGSRMRFLGLIDNRVLEKLVTSGNPRDHGSIQVDTVFSNSRLINRSGFGDFLKYFSNEMTEFSSGSVLDDGDDSNNPAGGEILPGLSEHTNLRRLVLRNSGLTRLTSDSWNVTGTSLEYVDLYENNISEIGEDVFNSDVPSNYLEIDLRYNKLNESSFHPNSGIARAGRRMELNLRLNQIASLPALVFEPFLDAHPQNLLLLDYNPLICDQRLSWLKSRRDELQNRVEGAKCSNDPGHNAFDSELIP